jgi:hypothetical protein
MRSNILFLALGLPSVGEELNIELLDRGSCLSSACRAFFLGMDPSDDEDEEEELVGTRLRDVVPLSSDGDGDDMDAVWRETAQLASEDFAAFKNASMNIIVPPGEMGSE